MRIFLFSFLFILSTFLSFSQSPKPGSGVLFPDPEKLTKPEVEISGELKAWHKLTLTFDGPHASEYGQSVFIFNSETGELDLDVRPEAGPKGRLGYMHPNPFLDFRMTVTFSHESGNPVYKVPGYFASDGNAAETGAKSGNKWRAHLSPDKKGRWDYHISFAAGVDVAIEDISGHPYLPYDGISGSFQVEESDKAGRDFRAKGRLLYTGDRYLSFAGNGEIFLKAGSDSPESLLGYDDFDGTETMMVPGTRGWIGPDTGSGLHRYEAHIKDWREGDPIWHDGKGKGLLGGINYLAAQGMNSISFLSYSAGGDGENVWPWVCRHCKHNYDVSKLDQWEIVFEHAQKMGMFLHFKLQETENDAGFPYRGQWEPKVTVPEALDGGTTGRDRKLYTREMIARFGHHLALNWNLGEETMMLAEHHREWLKFLASIDPYQHHRVIHTGPAFNLQTEVYDRLVGDQSELTGASVQTHFRNTHQHILHWINTSQESGKQWAVASDEQGPAMWANPTDNYDVWVEDIPENRVTIDDMRKYALWASFMAGGWGIEYYFGYNHANNDLVAENWSSREKTWTYSRYALEFFKNNKIPVQNMQNHNNLVGNDSNNNSIFCFAKPGDLYLVYLPNGGSAELDLSGTRGAFTVNWYNPRIGGILKNGTVKSVNGGKKTKIGLPPDSTTEDWMAVIRKR
jgi:hypothetical protein